jgi:hypothetical protein
MATTGTYNLTLSDLAKRMDPQGKHAKIVEILDQENEILQDATFIECNDGDSHQTTLRTAKPVGTWRRFNEGVAPAKSAVQSVKHTTGQLEAVSVVDQDLAEKGGKMKEVRANEARSFISGLGEQLATALIYEDERTNPTRITGLAPHYSTLSTATAASAENVITGSGAGSDNTSVWGITWGEDACTGIVPQGSSVGLQHIDEGLVDVVDSTGIAGSTFRAYRDRFKWKVGLSLRDWTTCGRIPNIDVSNLRAESSNADLIKLMIRLSEQLRGNGRKVFYVNRTVRTWLRIQILNRVVNNLTWETVGGKRVMVFDEIPVKLCDAILNTEAAVV